MARYPAFVGRTSKAPAPLRSIRSKGSTAVELAKHVRNFRAELHRTAGDDLIEKRHRGFSSQIL